MWTMKPTLNFLTKIAHYPSKSNQQASLISKKCYSYSTTSGNLNHSLLSRYTAGAGLAQSSTVNKTQIRNHHPSPFDPQTTKGWKAALKVCCNTLFTLCRKYILIHVFFFPFFCI